MATTGTPRRSPPPAPQGPADGQPPLRKGPRRKRRPQSPFWRAVSTAFQFVIIVFLLAAIGVMIWVVGEIRKSPSQIDVGFNPPGRTVILSSDGVTLATYFTENRKQVSLSQIPADLQNATIDLEDRRFRTRKSALDLKGIGRALTRNLRHGDMHGEGASTLTQQLARNLGAGGLTRHKSFARKLHEWIVANQMEKTYTKDEILEMYLNDVYYGSGAYGVEAAAETYFGKDVSKLDLAQCALLAGLPNQPSTYNPYRSKRAAEQQRNIVLDQMLELGHITPAQCAAAKAEYIHLASPHPPRLGSKILHAPYFVTYVVDQLRHDLGSSFLMNGNLQITTTLNWEMQQKAEDVVRQHMANAMRGGPTQAALVAIDQHTGEIKAMVGGSNFNKHQYNMVTQAQRQPGSLFKAIVYSAAIDSGVVTENTTVYDGPVSYPGASGKWTPKDDDGYRNRSVTLKEAMAQSINVVAVKVLREIGPATAVKYARLMGIRPETELDPVLSLALGSSAVTPLEMANVYATIANGGNRPIPIAYTHVQDDDGKTILDVAPSVVPHVIGPDAAAQLDDMLHAVCQYGTGARAGSQIAGAHGKTGTTQGHKDTWFIGYTDGLTCAIWAGHPVFGANKTDAGRYGVEMAGNSWGATVCVPMWIDFMKGVQPIMAKLAARYGNKPKPVATTTAASVAQGHNRHPLSGDATGDSTRTRHPSATGPDIADNNDGTVTATVDDDTGLLAPAGSSRTHRATFTKGAEPTQMAPRFTSPEPIARPDDNNSGTQAAPDSSDDSSPDSNGGSGGQTDSQTDGHSGQDGQASGDQDSEQVSTPDGAEPPRHSAVVHRYQPPPPPPPKPKPAVQYVTVLVNPEDGLLATRWTPEVVEKRFVKGTEPHKYTPMYAPPPGER